MNIIKTGTLIKEMRTEKNLTQKELAEKLNVSTAAVSKWENGKGFPDISILEPLSLELDISITELIKGEKNIKNNESDSFAKDLIEISKKEIKYERTRQIFIFSSFLLAVIVINVFVICDMWWNYKANSVFSFSNTSFIGLFMLLFGANAIVFALFNLIMGKKYALHKTMQISLFSEACCIASVWLSTVYTSYKVSVNDISAVLDTANALELYSRMLFLITVMINVFAFWRTVKNK